jgi:hypothetical protein
MIQLASWGLIVNIAIITIYLFTLYYSTRNGE